MAKGKGGTIAKLDAFTPFDGFTLVNTATVTKDGVRETTGPMTEKWIGTTETYKLSQQSDTTHLAITILTNPDFAEMFEHGWRKALKLIKTISENR